MNGGMKRCFHILHQLAKYFEVTAIMHQDKESFIEASAKYPEISNIEVHSTKEQTKTRAVLDVLPARFENAMRYRWIKKKLWSTTDGNFLRYHPLLEQLLSKNTYDAVILENLSTVNAVSVIRKYDREVKIVYDAHNIDSQLAAGTENHEEIFKLETNLYKHVNAVFVCSEHDRNVLEQMNRNRLKAITIPNGIEVTKELYDEGVKNLNPQHIIFCGALSTKPNREGLHWFYDMVWPRVRAAFPGLKLLVVGSGNIPETFQPLLKDSSLIFTGAVGDVKPFYNQATIAIVPLLNGSGTRLKVLEAMNLGVPVVSTTKGAEGIEYTNNKEIVIADSETDFAKSVIELLDNKNTRLEMQMRARKLVEQKYDWDVIGEKLSNLAQLTKTSD